MKVLYFHQYFSTPEGAGGTRSYKFALRLIERGHEVTMVCGTPDRGVTSLTGPFRGGKRVGVVDGIKVIELHLPYSNRDGFLKRTLTFLRYALRSLVLVFTEKHDLIFATSTPLTAGIPGIVANLLMRKKFVFEVRDLWPELPREMGVITNPFILKAMDLLEWLSYYSAVKCIALSPGIVEGIARRGVDKKNIVMIPNGCDLDIFSPSGKGGKHLSNFDNNDFVAIFAGAHGMANGLDAVLDVAAELKRRNRFDIKILMVGSGKLKQSLMQRAEDEALTNCIFQPPVPKRELANLFKEVDVGLMILANVPAFYYGTSPNKFFDYIAAGLPVVNNYPGWIAEMITANSCGKVVPPSDSRLFADALESLADNLAELQPMGRNSRLLAEREFERCLLADKFVDWLEDKPQLSSTMTVEARSQDVTTHDLA